MVDLMKYVFAALFLASTLPVLLVAAKIAIATKSMKWRILYWFLLMLMAINMERYENFPVAFLFLCAVAICAYVAYELHLLSEKGKRKIIHDKKMIENIKKFLASDSTNKEL
jgi:hypothetical protein